MWLVYPNHKEKKPAYKMYQKMNPSLPSNAILIKAINAQVNAKALADKCGKFYPEFPTLERWLKKEKWDDEVESPTVIDQSHILYLVKERAVLSDGKTRITAHPRWHEFEIAVKNGQVVLPVDQYQAADIAREWLS